MLINRHKHTSPELVMKVFFLFLLSVDSIICKA